MSFDKYKKIYCIGIGGIGVSGIARLFHALGKQVVGSDLKQSNITDDLQKLGVSVLIAPNAKVLVDMQLIDPDLVIYSNAFPREILDDIDCEKWSHGEAVAKFMEGKYGIGVTGTNGKSTTAALLGLILEQAGTDPTVLIGSQISKKNETEKFKANARLGNSEYVVAESDEYARKMLLNHPKMIILTNVAEDHLDVYKDLEDIKAAFKQYAHSLPNDGILIYNADDHNSVEVGRTDHGHKYTFGIDHYADLQAVNLKTEPGGQSFDLHLNDEMMGTVELSIPGKFNVSNALAAILAALKLNIPFEVIKNTLASFAGIWRRFEVVGDIDGKPVVSDYAHHPAGVAGTIGAAKEFFPGKKILVVFQPHQRNRTKALLGQFVESLYGADYVVLPEIFDVAGREYGERISSKNIADDLTKHGVKAEYAADLKSAEAVVKSKLHGFDVVLCMGAGDIDGLARELVHGH